VSLFLSRAITWSTLAWVTMPEPGLNQPSGSALPVGVVGQQRDRDVALQEVLRVAQRVHVAVLDRLQRSRVDVARTDEVVLAGLLLDPRERHRALVARLHVGDRVRVRLHEVVPVVVVVRRLGADVERPDDLQLRALLGEHLLHPVQAGGQQRQAGDRVAEHDLAGRGLRDLLEHLRRELHADVGVAVADERLDVRSRQRRGVHRHDRDALGDGLGERAHEQVGRRRHRRDAVARRAHRGLEQRDLLRAVDPRGRRGVEAHALDLRRRLRAERHHVEGVLRRGGRDHRQIGLLLLGRAAGAPELLPEPPQAATAIASASTHANCFIDTSPPELDKRPGKPTLDPEWRWSALTAPAPSRARGAGGAAGCRGTPQAGSPRRSRTGSSCPTR
jgi:hypothetical protein